jgi:protein Tex
MLDLISIIAKEMTLQSQQVETVITLTAEGATVPFLARYRKEATNNLDEVQIRDVLERHKYLTELEERKSAVLKSIEEQGKLTDELKGKIVTATEKQALEDLYAPYKPKRRTRAMIAKERGLEPLTEKMLAQLEDKVDIREVAKAFVSIEKGVIDEDVALAGARDILAEKVSDDASIRALLREKILAEGIARGEVIVGKEEAGAKFRDYFDYHEPVSTIPSHRILALRRGEAEEFLSFRIESPDALLVATICGRYITNPASPWAKEVAAATEDSYQRLLSPTIEAEVRLILKKRADEEAILVFAKNLRSLMLASPLGGKRMMAVDPGFRSGCKLAILSETGRFLDTEVIYPHNGASGEEMSKLSLVRLVRKHKVEAIAIGNGTASRETEKIVREAFKENKEIVVVIVDEAGASVYSASDIAREEFPELDVTVRGAISIGRRLQDPLAELVKVDPKAIGVGQYQHDVDQPRLKAKLSEVVESCVNTVGVDANLASAALLSYVSGIGPSLAKNIVAYRDQNGSFKSRAELRNVPRFGAKTFEQAAGFLKIAATEAHPLDVSAVHPERYSLVETIAKDLGVPLDRLIRDQSMVNSVKWEKYVTAEVGMPTLKDIAEELKRPGRDPRADFSTPVFDDAVTAIEHLKEGMVLEGTVTNVTNFGAFVNIGVHQDGLVHVSHVSHQFVKDPTEVLSAGQKVKVKVLAVDVSRKRISLSIREASAPPAPTGKPSTPQQAQRPQDNRGRPQNNNNRGQPNQGNQKSASGNSSFGTLADKLKGLKL